LKAYSQINSEWSKIELEKANTVEGISYLNQIEKEAILVLNLARMYPRRFIELELKTFNGTPKYGDYIKDSKYKKSLISKMQKMEPMKPLTPDSIMYENAKCFAIESGKRGSKGHSRKKCEKMNFGECCSYGMETGKEIILQLLIDHNVPSLGHRKLCLDESLTKIGVGESTHKKWDTCSVIELK
jgi:hypothetical protein